MAEELTTEGEEVVATTEEVVENTEVVEPTDAEEVSEDVVV